MKNKKSTQALKAYAEKIKTGEVERAKTLDPIQKAKQNPKSLRAAINGKCYDCCCGNKAEVSRCKITECTLYAVRPWQRT